MIGNQAIRLGTLRWVVGVYCVIRGAMVLIVPHQFNITFQTSFEPYFALIGGALLAGGTALIAAAGRTLAPGLALAAHLLAGAAIGQIALTAVLTGGVLGPISFDKKGDITKPDYVMYTWKKNDKGVVDYSGNEVTQ